MKAYEAVPQIQLTPRMPKIIRIDGRAFHTYTRRFAKPFDDDMYRVWAETASVLCHEISGAKLAYFQSDECSVLVTDYDALGTQAWFDNNIQKMVSVAASIATAAWNQRMNARKCGQPEATFDARVFALPKEEVCNYFIWRQRDAARNSVSSLAHAHFSHKRLHGLTGEQKQELLWQEKRINWAHLPEWQKNGAVVRRFVFDREGVQRSEWWVDEGMPIFSKDRSYIEQFVYLDGERP